MVIYTIDCRNGSSDLSLRDKIVACIITDCKSLDFKRAFMFGALGSFMNGVTLSFWYRALERMVGSSMVDKRVIAGKCILDQLIYAPFSIIIYFGYTAFMTQLSHQHGENNLQALVVPVDSVASIESSTQGLVPASIMPLSEHPNRVLSKDMYIEAITSALGHTRAQLSDFLVEAWIADCFVWPITNYISFSYISLNFRPTFVGIIQIFWQSYLSFTSHRQHKTPVPVVNSASQYPSDSS
jgi:hypothetical protein